MVNKATIEKKVNILLEENNCDYRAQLESTAKSYPNIQNVLVFLNKYSQRFLAGNYNDSLASHQEELKTVQDILLKYGLYRRFA